MKNTLKYWLAALGLIAWLVLSWFVPSWLHLQGNQRLDTAHRPGRDWRCGVHYHRVVV